MNDILGKLKSFLPHKKTVFVGSLEQLKGITPQKNVKYIIGGELVFVALESDEISSFPGTISQPLIKAEKAKNISSKLNGSVSRACNFVQNEVYDVFTSKDNVELSSSYYIEYLLNLKKGKHVLVGGSESDEGTNLEVYVSTNGVINEINEFNLPPSDDDTYDLEFKKFISRIQAQCEGSEIYWCDPLPDLEDNSFDLIRVEEGYFSANSGEHLSFDVAGGFKAERDFSLEFFRLLVGLSSILVLFGSIGYYLFDLNQKKQVFDKTSAQVSSIIQASTEALEKDDTSFLEKRLSFLDEKRSLTNQNRVSMANDIKLAISSFVSKEGVIVDKVSVKDEEDLTNRTIEATVLIPRDDNLRMLEQADQLVESISRVIDGKVYTPKKGEEVKRTSKLGENFPYRMYQVVIQKKQYLNGKGEL